MKKAVPWVALFVLMLSVTVLMLRPTPSAGSFNLEEFARLPVMMDGRVQPIESAARSALLRIRQTPTLPVEGGRTLQSTEWLLEALVKPHVADGRAIFPVEDPDLHRDVDPASGAVSGVRYYSFNQLAPKLEDIRKRGEELSELRAEDRRAAERPVLTLLEALVS
ncbi:MAG: hypothetical protein EHM84_07580 [Lysobacterales bacterium]|nr:MAG: hypothetical protein EHM84_07580 [Xanthomonadales bacterium]